MIIEGNRSRLKACRHGLMLYLKQDMYIGKALELYGEYSESETCLFREIIAPDAIIIEAGANIGTHTVPLARMAGLKGAVYAFEPQRQVHQILCANLALNEIENVKTYQAGLGQSPGRIEIAIPDYASANNIGSLSLGHMADNENYEGVDVMTIDSLNLQRLDFLKADVEGMEREVLLGARESIMRCRPILYLENDRSDRSAQLIQTVFDLGYRAWWHIALFFNPANHAGNVVNEFPPTLASFNLLCLPREMEAQVNNMTEILSVDASSENAVVLAAY